MFNRKKTALDINAQIVQDMNKSFAAIYKILENVQKTLDHQDKAIKQIDQNFSQLVVSVNTSLNHFAGQTNQALTQADAIGQQVEKNLQTFRECSIRMQLIQALNAQMRNPDQAMAKAQEITDFVLTGKRHFETASVVPLKPVR